MNSTIELRVLGATELRRDDRSVASVVAGAKRLGLLAYLVLARPRSFHRRDRLLPLFWPDQGQKAARNALSNLLYHIRRGLGDDVIVNRGAEEIGVRPGRVWCDVFAFEDALEAGAARQALDLYRGDLLAGFHLSGAAPDFVQWLDRERERLRRRAAEGAWRLAEQAEAAADVASAQQWARHAAAFTPFSDAAHARLIDMLDRLGDRAQALAAYHDFEARLRQEWGIEPSEEVRARAARARSHPARAVPMPELVGGSVSDRSIAVLPFEILGPAHPGSFTEGIHGDLLTRLSSVADLKVISRTSVRQYRDTAKTIPTIGEELGAEWVLEGEVQEAGAQVRVNVRLVEARTDRHVWARDYRRQLTAENLFRMQGDIAREIVRSLAAELTPEEQQRLEERPTANLDAYRLYVQGRTHLDQRTEAGMQRARDYFRQAIEQDADYVLAWVGLADAFALLHDYGYAEADRTLPRAEEAVHHALSLDPHSAEAHASLGLLHSVRFEGPPALRELGRAVDLRPGYAEAHNWLSWVSLLLGDRDTALQSAKRAVERNPLSPEAVSNLALSHLVNGSLDEALAEARRDRELGSGWETGRFYEGLVLHALGRFAEAIEVLDGVAAPWAGLGPRGALALSHVRAGHQVEAERLATEVEAAGDSFAAGLVHAALGRVEAAFDAFEATERLSDWPALSIRYLYPDVWSVLRPDPRYAELRRTLDRAWGLAG